MKKALIIIAIVVVAGALSLGYFMYRALYGYGELVGKQAAVPKSTKKHSPITKGPDDWPNWRGKQFNSHSKTVIIKDWRNGLQKLWEVDYLCQKTYTASWATPVVQGNRLIVTGRDETKDLVFCLDPQSGELIWSSSYISKAQSNHGRGARATPCIDDDRVYTFARNGELICWMLKDGSVKWRQNVATYQGVEPTWGHSSSPFVYQDKVFVQSGGPSYALAFNKMTGELVWKSAPGSAGYSAFAMITVGDVEQLLVFYGKGLAGVNPNTGKELWSSPWETSYDVNATTPLVCASHIFITSGYKKGSQLISLQNGKASILWKQDEFASHHSDPIFLDGYIYGYSGQSTQNRGYLKCLDLKTGDQQWASKQAGWGTLLYADGHLICLDIKGNLYLIKPDPKKFIKIAEYKRVLGKVRAPAWTAPIIANGRLYLRYMQRLICYDIKG